jgi:broad specificity phosphatase PhoE
MIHPVRLLLLRHGEVEQSYHRVFGGRIDMELSPRGHEQAAALARYLRSGPLDAIYVSPMRRAQQTLAPLAGQSSARAVVKPEFREVDFGDWTGLTWEQVHSRFGIHAFDWLEQLAAAAIPNAESARTFRARVEPPLREIVAAHAGQTVAVVCHGGVVRMILSILLDLPIARMAAFEIDYASLTRVEVHANKTEVTLLNFTPWRDLA